jgi:transcriptional regulator with XRE-family HTH domain
MIYADIGKRLSHIRKRVGLSQAGLAAEAAVSRNYISIIERGDAENISIGVLVRLADALEVTPFELLGHLPEVAPIIPMELREFGLAARLSLEVVEKLARIPSRELRTIEEWRKLYECIRFCIEGDE